MKYFVFALFFSFGVCANAQSPRDLFHGKGGEQGSGLVADKGTWNVGVGGLTGFYINEVKTNIFGFDSTFTDSAGAVYLPIRIEYCFFNKVSGGIAIKFGKYIDDLDYSSNIANVFDVFVCYHFLKKEKNDLYARLELGGAKLVIEDSSVDARGEWSGSHVGLGIGYRHYFGQTIGVDVHLGNSSFSLKQNSLSVGNTNIDPEDLSWDIDLSGFEFGFGLVAKF